MKKIKTMVNGIPGDMAVTVAHQVHADQRFELIPASLTGPEIQENAYGLAQTRIRLIRPEERVHAIGELKKKYGDFLCVDYTHPSAVNDNASFYCRHERSFVMGTTGGNRGLLAETVLSSSIAAVIAPNMAKQIVGFQAMMEYAADTFADLFKGYRLEIKESHQQGKADTSGTAKAMVGYFNKLGIPYAEEMIIKERDPQTQMNRWGIPQPYLTGHGWHTYTLVSEDRTVKFEFTHNVNGRDVYAEGTLAALIYLNHRVQQGARGRVYTMIDVLKGS